MKTIQVQYKVLEGVRFDTRIKKSRTDDFFHLCDTEDQAPESSGLYTLTEFKNDNFCILEHDLIGSTSPVIRNPLIPYQVYIGKALIAKCNKERKKRNDAQLTVAKIDSKSFGNNVRLSIPHKGKNNLSVVLEIDPSAGNEFLDFIRENVKSFPASCEFRIQVELNDDGTIKMPELHSLGFWRDEVELPKQLKGKIHLSEYTNHNPFASEAFPELDFIIDKEGYRVKIKE